MSQDLNQITGSVIGAAIEVHRALGPGLLESAYRSCHAAEMRDRGHVVVEEVALPIRYKELRIDTAYRIDMVVDGQVVVELKTVDKIVPVHRSQILTYLQLSGLPVGLLINFNERYLMDGVHRFVWRYRGPRPPARSASPRISAPDVQPPGDRPGRKR